MEKWELPLKEDSAPRPGLLDLPMPDLKHWLGERNQPAHRARQIHRWMVSGRAVSFDQMTDLPQSLRTELSAEFTPFASSIVRHLKSSDGTEKVLLRLGDSQVIECVLMREAQRCTVCISTQVGCGMGCVFCASGINGVVRNLRPAEILEQLLHCRNLLGTNERLSHIVVMGMGEPLANLDALLQTLAIACAPTGLGLSARHVTISTVGIPSRIRQLADLNKRYHLAVSLHAPSDDLRNRIVPTNEKMGLADILAAADYFQNKTGRQVTYEYILLRNVNDRPAHAAELGRLLRGRGAHVNLIPFNEVAGLPFERPDSLAIADFQAILHKAGISATTRKRRGADIDAACGQLRRSALERQAIEGRSPAGGAKERPEPVSTTGV